MTAIFNEEWSVFDDGITLDQVGPEGSVVLRDEEHPLGARFTMEQGGAVAPFTITCGVYGLLMHTRFFGSQANSEREYDAMKIGLVKVAEAEGQDSNAEASAFVERFP